jgi:hypothetical protein
MINITDLVEMVKTKRIQAIIDNDMVQFYEIRENGTLCGYDIDKEDYYPTCNPQYLLADVLEILGFKVGYP